jgi:hypothetical protein
MLCVVAYPSKSAPKGNVNPKLDQDSECRSFGQCYDGNLRREQASNPGEQKGGIDPSANYRIS